MKRDLNLCRDLLLELAGGKSLLEYDIPKSIYDYHARMLYDAGFIDDNYFLTMKGHDVVSLIRDKNTWDYIMSVSDKVGGLPFDIILEWSKEELLKKVHKILKDKESTKTYNDSGFVKKDLVFTPELDKRFNSQNVGYAIADAYLLAKDGRYESALLKLNFYMRTSIFSNDTIELPDNCADEIELLLDHILDNLPFN